MHEQPSGNPVIYLRKYGTDELIAVPGKSDPEGKPQLRNYNDVIAEREQPASQPSFMARVGQWLQAHAPAAATASPSVPEPRDVIFLKDYETHEPVAVVLKPNPASKPKLRDYTSVLAERAAAHQQPSSMQRLGEWLETHAPDAPAATPGKPASKPLGQYRS